MTTITDIPDGVTVGVDTHKDIHVAAVCDGVGRVLGTAAFASSQAGYDQLVDWAESFGPIHTAGIEGTGSWGTGLARRVAARGVRCIEVNRPNRKHRRQHGKSDTADAIGAARSVLSGEATGTPRGNNANVEALRVTRVALRSAIQSRSQALNQLKALINTAPDELRARLEGLRRNDLITTATKFRPGPHPNALTATKAAMRSLARRISYLDNEITELKTTRNKLVTQTAPPELLNQTGVGPEVATSLLIAFGDNPGRIHTEAAFAALCGASPINASSGTTTRHRLNRNGDRQANSALWRIALVRMSCDPETTNFINRTTARGKTKKEAIRILKRHIARQIWRLLNQHPPRLDNL